MTKHGKSFVADEELSQEGEALFGRLQEYDVNGLRHTMFGSRTTDPAKLPPCKVACDQHMKCANY